MIYDDRYLGNVRVLRRPDSGGSLEIREHVVVLVVFVFVVAAQPFRRHLVDGLFLFAHLVDEVRHVGRGEQEILLCVMHPDVPAARDVPVVGGRLLMALSEERVLLLLHFRRVAVYERRGRAHGRVHGRVRRHAGREHGLLLLGPVMHAVDASTFTVQLGDLVLGDGHVLHEQADTTVLRTRHMITLYTYTTHINTIINLIHTRVCVCVCV